MPNEPTLRPSESLRNVRYEIRGKLANRAHGLTRQGYEIISLNIGNCHQKGIFPAREAVVMQQQARGVTGVTADEVFIGNGVSELIDLALRALLNEGDEVLVPSPDYPLWTAAATLNGGRVVHYPCLPENKFVPDPEDIEQLVTKKTRAIVVINPNNPTGAYRGTSQPRRVRGRDLRPDDLRWERVHSHGDSGEGHALRHDVGPLEGLSCVRLSRGLAVIRWPQEQRG
jgi:hypothetical protein